MKDALLILTGYVLGSMPWGYWLPRILRGVNIRKFGSGSTGAANVWRTLGFKIGLGVALLDLAAVWVCAFLATRYTSVASMVSAVTLPLFALLFGASWLVVAFAAGAAVAIFVLHRANITRLVNRSENRFELRRTSKARGGA